MSHQEALTIIAEITPQGVPAVQRALAELEHNPGDNGVLPFASLPGVHFGRVLLLPESRDLSGKSIPAQLLLLTDCDGPSERHLEAVADVAACGLDRLFGHSPGYPPGKPTRQQRVSFLRAKAVQTSANYVHRQGRTVTQIRRESELYQALLQFTQVEDLSGLSAGVVRDRIRSFVRRTGSLRWALEAPEGLSASFKLRRALHLPTLPLGLAALGPLLFPVAALILALVRRGESRADSPHIRPTVEHTDALFALEDHVAHSGFTAGGYVKPGWVRQAVLRSVLPLIGYGTRHIFTRDSLAGVKTIHFARWIPLDGGRRVIFCSNYDGSLESYNNDFIDLVAWGLNLVFSNGLGYPQTRWLIHGGARREQEFKDYLRRHQIPTPVWYSAYPHLTAVQVERNAKLRAGLRGHMNESEAQQWLRLL